MDLTIPYTFYPTAMPGWIAWVLFLTAAVGATATMLASMVITFFLHDV